MNRYIKHIAVIMFILFMGAYSCELDKINACPCITSIAQSTARLDDNITLNGDFTNLDTTKDIITIGGNEADYEIVGSQIIAKVPSGIVSDKVQVLIDAQGCGNVIESCKKSFDYKKVTVSGIDPTMEEKGKNITITGSDFNTQDLSKNKVMFGNVLGTVVSANETELVVTVPIGAETGNVVVDVDGFEVTTGPFTYKYSLVGEVEYLGADCDPPINTNINQDTQCDDDSVFCRPMGLAIDSEGNVFVADEFRHQIFRIAANTGIITPFAGSKGVSGNNNDVGVGEIVPLGAARFNRPIDLAFDADTHLYITDSHNGQIRRIVAQEISTHIASLNFPIGIDVDRDKNIYFTELSTSIKLIPKDTRNIENYAPGLDNPTGLMMADDGKLYLANTGNSTLKYVDPSTNNVIDFAGKEDVNTFQDGPVSDASFNEPTDVHLDKRGNLFVVDRGNGKVRVVTPTLIVYSLYGNGDSDDCVSGMKEPYSLVIDEGTDQNILYVSDTRNRVIKKIVFE